MSEGPGIGRGTRGTTTLHHRAFEPRPAAPLPETALSDRLRLAVLLQAAALLHHLARARCHLPSGLDNLALDAESTLVLPLPHEGPSPFSAQAQLGKLLEQLFGGAGVAGRSPTRRVLRLISQRWRQGVLPLPAEGTVAEILEEAPFLWQAAFAPARRYLVGELESAGRLSLSLALPPGPRRRFLARAGSRPELERLLASEEAQVIWTGARPGSEAGGASKGALPKRGERARQLLRQGRYRSALELLAGEHGPSATLDRLRCQVGLGRWGAARAQLRELDLASLPADEALTVCELAIRCCANLGEEEAVESWAGCARELGRGKLRLRALLVAAVAFWDLSRFEAMERLLSQARSAQEDAALTAAWHRARALLAQARGRWPEALEELRLAFRSSRRSLDVPAAGELWNEIGVARAGVGDLPGAERAFRHTVRLWAGCQGPRPTTLALANLAEIRLRRGRLAGVRELLEQVSTENRLGRNLRGGIHDAELASRFELASGRPQAALTHCQRALEELRGRGWTFRRPVLLLLSARALGWLRAPERAFAALEQGGREALEELEPEERPALLALAGDRERALEHSAGTSTGELWLAVLEGQEVPFDAWRPLENLEPYRAARLIHDVHRLRPEAVPENLRRRSAGTFRSLGATAFAEGLEAADQGPWAALLRYLDTPGAAAIPALFRSAGYGEVRLEVRAEDHLHLLLDGLGGATPVSRRAGLGLVVAHAAAADPVLEALVAFTAHELEGSPLLRELESARPAGEQAPAAPGIIGSNAKLLAALDRLRRLSRSEMPILLTGESGTGKELAAALVHGESSRSARPFVPFNCAAVSENLLLSDLFGHVRGAFTGADRERLGVFEAAGGGTVFLDEIGDLPLSCQGMLLRLIQEGEVRRLGESLPRKVKVRLVAATHRDLAQMVSEGTFRQDLYFRLKVAAVKLPALRERLDDLPALCRHFLRKLLPGGSLSKAAEQALASYRWPGNIRELGNVLAVAAALAEGEGGWIEPHHLDLETKARATSTSDFHTQLDSFRRQLIQQALEASGGNQAEAARRLGLTRQALSYLVRRAS